MPRRRRVDDHDVERPPPREAHQLDEPDELVDAGERQREEAIDVLLVQVRPAIGDRPDRLVPIAQPPGERPVSIELGREELAYDETSYFLSSVALPITGRVAKASPAAPYLSVMIPLTPALIGPVLANAALPGSERGQGAAAKGVDVRALDLPLLDAVLRLVRLIDTPEHAPVLAPLVLHEIVYRLLVG